MKVYELDVGLASSIAYLQLCESFFPLLVIQSSLTTRSDR